MPNYSNRTLESIAKEHAEYTYEGGEKLYQII